VAVRGAEPQVWTLEPTPLLGSPELRDGVAVFTVVRADANEDTGLTFHRLAGRVVEEGRVSWIEWGDQCSSTPLELAADGAWLDYRGASLTARAFDRTADGLGKWLVTLASWLFALSTMISWSYYGEQGVIFVWGRRGVKPFKLAYCALIVVATIPALVQTDEQLDALTSLGTGLMLWANLPILWLFGRSAMRAYRRYMGRLRRGEFDAPQ
jgi:AGCS family alanine or glycine:cation symporter